MAIDLAPHERAGIEMLCGANQRMRAVFDTVAARQPRSIELQRRALRCASGLPTLGAFAAPILPLAIERAAGSRITDLDDNEYIDCHMAYTASILGHRPPAVERAVSAALGRGLGGGHFFAEQVELAELVTERVPGVERVALFHTGGEAVSAAVRMVRAATGKQRIAKFEGCYHGANEIGLHNTMMALAGRPPDGDEAVIAPSVATGGLRTASDDELMILPYGSPIALERLRQEAASLAGVVVDPVPPFLASWPETCKAFVRQLCALCDELEVPVIFDEVVSGFRLAAGGARQWSACRPALSCFAKIVSGAGLPLSMVAGDAHFVDLARSDGLFQDHSRGKVWVSSTLTASFLPIVAALAQLRDLAERYDEIVARLDRNHALLSAYLRDFAETSGIPVRLEGHPRLQMQLNVRRQPYTERSFRGIMAQASLSQYLSLLALSFYLRLEGVYTKNVPTMNLSAAHDDDDIEVLASAICNSLRRMDEDGMLVEG